MKKFMAFLYKFSTVVMLIVGIILCTLLATIAGLIISKGADLLKWGVGQLGSSQDIESMKQTIDSWFAGISWKTSNLSVAGKVLISIFSINVGLLGMFVVFGILSVGYRAKVRREGKKALKAKKQEEKVAKTQQYSYYSF